MLLGYANLRTIDNEICFHGIYILVENVLVIIPNRVVNIGLLEKKTFE